MTDNTEEKQDEKEYTAFEEKCMDAGWNPNGKKSAEDWALDGLSVRNEKITDLYRLHDNLKDLMSKQEKNIYEQARKELAAERDAAIDRGDRQAVKQIDEEQEKLTIQTEIQSAANDFIQRNSAWYNSNDPKHLKMQKAAKEMDIALAPRRMSPKEHFAAIDAYMQDEFADQFEEAPKKRSQAVEGGRSTVTHSSGKQKYGWDDLTPMQRKFAEDFHNAGIMTKDKYIEELVKAGKVK